MAAAVSIAGWTSNPGPNWWSDSHVAVDPTAIGVADVYYLADDGSPLVGLLACCSWGPAAHGALPMQHRRSARCDTCAPQQQPTPGVRRLARPA